MSKISVILATFNEEKNIKECLESVKWADEIVIVDGTSNDKTVEIAKKYTKKIIVKDNPLMFHINKQLAIEKTTGDWILYIDADERVTPELKQEFLTVMQDNEINGYWIPRKNIIFGKWIEHTGWSPDYQLRFFRNGKGKLPCKSVHEQPVVEGNTRKLINPLIHYNYNSVNQFLNKLINIYTENDKKVKIERGEKIESSSAIRFPVDEFLKRFYLEAGYKDGLHGLVLSMFQSFSSFVTFAKIWEEQDFPEFNPKDFLNLKEVEFKNIAKAFNYWFLTVKINNTNNILLKNFYRLKRKLLSFL